ncbi:MAG: hypothetical protein JJU28_00545 [Cyclobacteriaceae bacterium]|nr:hypothetical protein [Cyclobacteriaceae bacterium]
MKAEITHRIIDYDFVKENLIMMLPGSILLDENFQITGLSSDICQLTMQSENEILNRSVFELFLCDGLKEKIITELSMAGFFQGQSAKIAQKFGNYSNVELSGFYLGMLSDFSNQILITVKDLSQVALYKERLQYKAAEFNELLYRSYHDLRGPLATIKGLVNLSGHPSVSAERINLIEMIGQTAAVLENRIKNLAEIFESGKALIESQYISKHALKDFISMNLVDTEIIAQFELNESDNHVLPDDLPVKKILNSVFEFVRVLSIKRHPPEVKISLASMFNNNLLLDVDIVGMVITDTVKSLVDKKTVFASEVIHQEDCLKYYILRNQIAQIDGILDTCIKEMDELSFRILIPSEVYDESI